MTIDDTTRIECSQESDALVLRIIGELDAASRDLIEPAILAAIPSASRVVLDLSAWGFCDSNGAAVLIAAQQQAESVGTGFVVTNPQPIVRRVFEICGLERLFGS